MSVLIGSSDNRKASLIDGELMMRNGTAPFPPFLSVTQARDTCALFDLDFEDSRGVVPVIIAAAANGGIGVRTAQLGGWIHAQRIALVSGGGA